MKYIVIIGDGMADFPLEQLGGKTPLMVAQKPNIDSMARRGYCGKVATIPDGFPPGSDVAGMSLFGYNPAQYYTGRAPIEAFGMDIPMGPTDVAFRCNLVNLDISGDTVKMGDYSGGHVTTDEARPLIEALNRELGNDDITFYPGVGYRHIMIWKNGVAKMETAPPHDITGKEISPYLPSGDGAQKVLSLMTASQEILARHPFYEVRRNSGKLTVNSIWLWGQGKSAALPSFQEKYGLAGATVCAVDLVRGISKMVGFEAPLVKGATGYLDTDYGAKAAKALELLERKDIVYIHVEAPDEASHNGNVEEKIRAIENIDREVVGPVSDAIGDGARFLIVTDHATPIALRTHYATPVPFVIFQAEKHRKGSEDGYDERAGSTVYSGEELVKFFLKEDAS